jgi:uncharacterized coiled-coil DUF342 family protein
MNKSRRASIAKAHSALAAIVEELGAARPQELLQTKFDEIKKKVEGISEDLSELSDEEQEYYDNMPEGLQMAQKGDDAQEAIDALTSGSDTLSCIDFKFEDVELEVFIEAIISDIEDARAVIEPYTG